MQSEELSEALNELEQRVERLRALYEQYFMGIEKIEPTVQRKDVDRRFWVLRREQIRNTAQRFKLNTINQRYNTYSQYWQRCMREIEAGTYRRHLVKAEKRFGAEALTIASRKRLGRKQETDLQKKKEAEERAQKALEQTPDLDEFDVDVDVDVDMSVFEQESAPTDKRQPSLRTQAARSAHALDELDDLEALMGLDAGPTVREASAHPPARAASPPPVAPPPPARAPRDAGFGELGGVFAEDEDDITAPQPAIPWTQPAAAGPEHAPRRSARPPRPAPLPPRTRETAPSTPAMPPPPKPPPPKPPPARPAPPKPTPAARPAETAARPPNRPAAKPTATSPAAKERDGLSDDRVREIYRDYVKAKRDCSEPTSSITEANLAQSLRTSAEKLRKKHKGRNIDYEVVIKGGRAVLKPVVKS